MNREIFVSLTTLTADTLVADCGRTGGFDAAVNEGYVSMNIIWH